MEWLRMMGICLLAGAMVMLLRQMQPAAAGLLCAALGVALACWMHWPAISPEVLLAGLASGLASTGLHQAVTQLFGGTKTAAGPDA